MTAMLTRYDHQGMRLHYKSTEQGLQQTCLHPSVSFEPREDAPSYPNFSLSVAGRRHGFLSGVLTASSVLPTEMEMTDIKHTEEGLLLSYRHAELGLAAEANLVFVPGAAVIRQTTTVRNDGTEPVTLTHLSSMCVQGIASEGCLSWFEDDKVKLHYCHNAWTGEGQWRSAALGDLGLYHASVHNPGASIHFSSVGSWSTSRYLPMAVLEDTETSQVWYFQIETSSNWHFEISGRGERQRGSALYISADGASERYGGWSHTLRPGESYTSVPVAYGCAQGGFDEAVRELTKYRRSVLKPDAPYTFTPVAFNDYMNCLWGNPDERLLPLIDAAAEAGAEMFVIDAGWFAGRDESWSTGLGTWLPSKDRFGSMGLEGILDRIKSKGMLPGVWLEMEVAGEESVLGNKPDNWFLLRHGKRVGGGDRLLLNYGNEELREYMHGVIDRLTGMGVRFIKNDYNTCVGIGAVEGELSAPEGLRRHSEAFYRFIDEVRKRHPQLIIENCGSGAMREDYAALSHFHYQSSSDQEFYYNNPSIITGSLAAVLPEQCGNWSYPYPLPYKQANNEALAQSPDYWQVFSDGEETIFNMINGICGAMYLSGHIHRADELNKRLIREGVQLYKQLRSFTHSSYPFWPIGFTRIGDTNAWAAAGFRSEDDSTVLLAVWRLASGQSYMELPIRCWAGKSATVSQLYPSTDLEVPHYYNRVTGTLTVRMPKTFQARLFELRLSESGL